MGSASDEFLLPLFPLPNLVFFPQTRLPLHIFEPRYRQLVADALTSEERFGIVLLKPGWEKDYYGTPDSYDVGTIAHIEQAVTLEDGRYNLLVRGDVRFRIIERVADAPYRIVRAVATPETTSSATDAYVEREYLAELSRQYLEFLRDQSPVPELDTAGLESLCNALILSLNLDIERKQEMLEIGDVVMRAKQVGSELESRIETLQFLAPYGRSKDPSAN